MQRTLIVHTGERLIKRENWLVLKSGGTEKRVFDLPTATPKERRAYTQFRKFLIQDGYDMLQYSVYSRITANHDDANVHLSHIRCHLPPAGSVRALLVTEKQYASMYILLGRRTATEHLLKDNDILEF